ncbi:MAG: DUF6807 family protein [Planctomycetota bacterium]|jgi:type 1 glutamine amidotransferase
MKNGKFCFSVLLIVILTAAAQLFAASSPRALILSGLNNHDWRKTTPMLKQILADNDIDADITENPGKITATMLSGYDVIVSNYNTFGTENIDWPDSAKKAFLDFISKGNGHVTVHAGGCSFDNWAQYQQIAAWWATTTGHGKQHAFPINAVDLDHPISSGLYPVWTRDELWHRTGFPTKSKTLITAFSSSNSGGSGDFEPILTVSEFGKGRCVNFMLGHDVPAMQNAAFKLLFTRSVQWAAGHEDLAAVPEDLPRTRRSLQDDDVDLTDNFTWKTTGTSIALMNKSKTVWRFNYSPEEPKPYFHPIALTDGTPLTWNKPSDHVWHHALWFSWKYINSVNYWEPTDRTKGTYAGLTKWSNVTIEQNDDHSAEIDMELKYHPAGQPAVLKEQRRIFISTPDNSGTYTMDWSSTFTAVAETVTLDRTPIPGQQGGRSSGGYAGLSVRISKDASDPKYITSTGVVELNNGTFRGKEKYMQYAAMIDDKDFTITILDSETNINSPTPWYLINNNTMDYFSPAVICYEPLVIAKGDSFTLRYRIIISPARLSTGQLNIAYDIFNKNTK